MKGCGKAYKNEEGIALVMVLILSAIALAIMAGLVFMLTAGTQMSGIQKRYKTALEAGKGGADVAFQLIAKRGELFIPDALDPTKNMVSLIAKNISGTVGGVTHDCMNWKLNTPTTGWPAECNSSSIIDPANSATYDMYFDLGTIPTFRVYGKIVDTVEGNSGADIGLLKSGVVSSNSGEVTAMSIPYLYTIEVDAMNKDNPSERARYSILYQY